MSTAYDPWIDLAQDVVENEGRLSSSDSQLNRRNFVRSLFALYEGTLLNLRETVSQLLIAEFEQSGQWRLHEIIPLLDESPRITRTGILETDSNRSPFLPLVAYTVRKYAELVMLKRDIFGDAGWQKFGQAIQVRHRITHPKREVDVAISDAEIAILRDSRQWWVSLLGDLHSAYARQQHSRSASM